jgi:hypothetical protein
LEIKLKSQNRKTEKEKGKGDRKKREVAYLAKARLAGPPTAQPIQHTVSVRRGSHLLPLLSRLADTPMMRPRRRTPSMTTVEWY